jgi:hypothetical protein
MTLKEIRDDNDRLAAEIQELRFTLEKVLRCLDNPDLNAANRIYWAKRVALVALYPEQDPSNA